MQSEQKNPSNAGQTLPNLGITQNVQTRHALSQFFFDLATVPRAFFKEAAFRMNHLPLVNFQLAQQLALDGRMRDAILRYRLSLWMAPDHHLSWYFLGTSYLSLGERDKALAAFARAYKLAPQHEETRFMIATINPAILPESKRPRSMPTSIATDYFDRLAPDYDRSQAARGYRAHIAAEASLREWLEPRRVNHSLLDIGCGTGAMGAMLAPYCEHIVGVDLARGMLALANERRRDNQSRIYSSAIQQDLRLFLPDISQPCDIITAVHVFNYVGDLSHVFEHVANALTVGGLFLFQIEPMTGEGYAMLPTASRFGHSEHYIQSQLKGLPLTILKQEMIQAYPDITMQQYILRKTA
ncbi:MAG: methyltransferase domain-containing protein [Rickettsiales bacterium]|nr:methyltransferase domain-containing protein [Rickettsiales bacterium]